MFDTDYAIQKIISDSGVTEQQARSFVRMVVDAQVELATKRDLKDLELAVKRDLTEAVTEIKQNIAVLNLKIIGLYMFMAAIAGGIAKLVFYP